jgi:hypothetical protein
MSENNGQASRRVVLKTVGSSATALSGYATSVSVVGADGPKKKINILAEGDRSVKSVSVSKKWHQHTRKTERVHQNFKNKISQKTGVMRVGIETGDKKIGGLLSHRIHVTVDSAADRANIPESIEGVPVRISEGSEIRPTGCDPDAPEDDCYRKAPDTVYGGLACRTDNTPTETANATTSCRVFLNGNKYLMTARHLFTDDLNECDHSSISSDQYLYLLDDTGDKVYTRPIGSPAHDFADSDAALVDTSKTSRSITNSITNEGSKGIVGRVTGEGLSYLKSNSVVVKKRGRCTCAETGAVIETGIFRYCNNLNHLDGMVKSTTDQRKRDSGGVVYFEGDSYDDKLYFVNIAMGNPDDGTHDTLGTSGEYMYNSHGVTFGGNPYS